MTASFSAGPHAPVEQANPQVGKDLAGQAFVLGSGRPRVDALRLFHQGQMMNACRPASTCERTKEYARSRWLGCSQRVRISFDRAAARR